MSESPTLEEPKVEEPEVKEADETQEILAKLNDLGIDDAEKVDNVVRASQESGNLARMLGEERQARAALEAQLRERNTQRQDLSTDEYGVDLGTVVRKEMENFWNDKQKVASEQQQRHMQEFNKIRSHKNYKLVGKDFEEYTKTPDYQQELMSGKTPSEIFYDMSNDRLRDYLVKMKNAIETRSVSPDNVAVPHTETNQASPPPVEPDNEKAEKLKDIKKNWKGDDSDIEKALNVLL